MNDFVNDFVNFVGTVYPQNSATKSNYDGGDFVARQNSKTFNTKSPKPNCTVYLHNSHKTSFVGRAIFKKSIFVTCPIFVYVAHVCPSSTKPHTKFGVFTIKMAFTHNISSTLFSNGLQQADASYKKPAKNRPWLESKPLFNIVHL